MSSKRHLRRKACDGKERLSKAAAMLSAAAMNQSSILKWSAYRCHFNGGRHWHIGHASHEQKMHDMSVVRKNPVYR